MYNFFYFRYYNYSKLGSSYNSLVKAKKYQDDIENKIDSTLYDVLHPQLEDDQSNTNDDWNSQNDEWDDGYDSYPSSGNSVRGDIYN
jgi:hypothetical protein